MNISRPELVRRSSSCAAETDWLLPTGSARCRPGRRPFRRRNGVPTGRLSSRRGAMFHYYMVYLLMTGTVMASAGLFLHSIFKSGYRDDLQRWHLQTLGRLEGILREDIASADEVKFLPETGLICRTAPANEESPTEVRWSVEKEQLHRTSRVNGVSQQHEKFRFVTGTSVTVQRRKGALIMLTISTPMMRNLNGSSGRPLAVQTDPGVSVNIQSGANLAQGVNATIRDHRTEILVFEKPASGDLVRLTDAGPGGER